ncbi:MAG: hypothetical protein ABIJ11_01900 [Elusimicrobiota bacterium]
MMKNKIETFLNRGEVRDCFDIEFLLRRGIPLNTKKENLIRIKNIIKSFKITDYRVALGSILEAGMRKYYSDKNFEYLISKIDEALETKQ